MKILEARACPFGENLRGEGEARGSNGPKGRYKGPKHGAYARTASR